MAVSGRFPPFTRLRSQVGRVGMWRGGGRIGLSVSAALVWRCLTSRAMAPFPHPAHRTGRALLTHPALGQDFTPSHTEGHEQPSDQPPGPWDPSELRSTRLLATVSATTWGDSSSLGQRPGSSGPIGRVSRVKRQPLITKNCCGPSGGPFIAASGLPYSPNP